MLTPNRPSPTTQSPITAPPRNATDKAAAIPFSFAASTSYIGAAGTIGAAFYPLVLSAVGIIASIIGIFFVRGKDGVNPQKALNTGENVSYVITIVLAAILSHVMLGSMKPFVAIVAESTNG